MDDGSVHGGIGDMRAEITKRTKAEHSSSCTFSVGANGVISYHCAESCAIAAIGEGDGGKGVAMVLKAFWQVERKQQNTKRRMKRKKRRGWA